MLSTTSALSELISSEAAYTALAAKREHLDAAEMDWAPSFTSLPAGCVVHSVRESEIPACSYFEWLGEVESRVTDVGAGVARILLQGEDSPLGRTLEMAGYERRARLAFIGSPCELAPELHSACRKVRSGMDWFRYMRTRLEGAGLLAAELDPVACASFTRAKAATGKLEAYLIQTGDTLHGAFCLVEMDGMLRLRELHVTPQSRGRGFGGTAVSFAGVEARRRGKDFVGAFAEDPSPAAALFRRAGLEAESQIVEWSRSL